MDVTTTTSSSTNTEGDMTTSPPLVAGSTLTQRRTAIFTNSSSFSPAPAVGNTGSGTTSSTTPSTSPTNSSSTTKGKPRTNSAMFNRAYETGYSFPLSRLTRIRSKKSKLLLLLAISAASVSIFTAYLGSLTYRGVWTSSVERSGRAQASADHSGAFMLPSAKVWGEGRAKRRLARKQRGRDEDGQGANKENDGNNLYAGSASFGDEDGLEQRGQLGQGAAVSSLFQVSQLEYDSYVSKFIGKILEEGNDIPPNASESGIFSRTTMGQDLHSYAQLGCSIFHQFDNPNLQSLSTKERMRQLWSSHLNTILEVSRHEDDSEFLHRDWTRVLLNSLSPYTLLDVLSSDRKENRGNSIDTRDIERILGTLVKRIIGLTNLSQNTQGNKIQPLSPPLRIAVFGGPTVEGKGCRSSKVEVPHGSIMANPNFCAFPYRLEQFLNGLFLPQSVRNRLFNATASNVNSVDVDLRLVEVLNLGEEGTNYEYATAIVRNRMYPPLFTNGVSSFGGNGGYGGGPPDVVVHAYGIDDHGGKYGGEMQHFYDALMRSFSKYTKEQNDESSRQCPKEMEKPPPIVIRAVLDGTTDSLSPKRDSTLSVMTTVLGDAVDDVEEGELSLPEVTAKVGVPQQTQQPQEMGTFGMAGHLASSWVLAFSLGYATLEYCTIEKNRNRDNWNSKALTNPLINPMSNVIEGSENNLFSKCDNGIDPPCVFHFLAGPKGTTSRPSAIASVLLPYVVENSGWQPESDMTAGFARKTGLVGAMSAAGAFIGDSNPDQIMPTITLLFPNITRPVRRLDVITLRSTSELWKDGVAQFVLVTGGDFTHGEEKAHKSSKLAKETSFEISAELIQDTIGGDGGIVGDQHISYHFGIDLAEGSNAGAVGTDVLLRIILKRGDKFKILGIMLCE